MIRIERAIRHLARERDHFLLRLEICGSERQDWSDHLRVEAAISPRGREALLKLLDRLRKRGDL